MPSPLTALKCEDPKLWGKIPLPEFRTLIICPDCGAMVDESYEKIHVDFHRGLNIWDPNYQHDRTNPYPDEEGGS